MATKMVEVVFLEDTIYETDGPKKGPKFLKDHTYEFAENFAQKWIIKGVARLVDEPKPIDETALRKKPDPEADPKPAEPSRTAPAPTQVQVTKPNPEKILGHKDLGLTPPPTKTK